MNTHDNEDWGRVTRAHGFDPAALIASREEIGLQRVDLSRLARIPDTTVLRWELGETVPSVRRLRAVVESLNKMRAHADKPPLRGDQLILIDPDRRELSYYRHVALLTPDEAAAQIGVSGTTLARIEKAQRSLTPELTARLAQVLDISADDVVKAWERASNRWPELAGGDAVAD
ncbi:helix-turn-helix transcriptional regulator [Nocardia asteroides]|uniref:helix-turn-helix transcriptional regulator n=1 Tax=Nocardia asteroides TaxID=1824 RepID=UPI001E43DF24|nr:helix-turn-helix transcriptional regulator [Nocardia asteroides]UGT58907.1 helix-turn-helix domain-containing protein [Nocardia asteroides]